MGYQFWIGYLAGIATIPMLLSLALIGLAAWWLLSTSPLFDDYSQSIEDDYE